MKLYLIQKKATYDITNVVTRITWSGSLEQASRSIEFSVINAPLDPHTKGIPNVATGDFVRLKESGDTLFFGMIFITERTTEIGDVAYTAYDLLYHFTKSSWCRSFKNKTAEAITKECCQEVGVTAGSIIATKVVLAKLLIDNETIYDTILKAYKKASKTTGKKYLIRMVDTKLSVIVKGNTTSKIMLTDSTNITKASIKEDAADIINRVKIYDDKGKQTGVVSSSGSLKKYGVFQAVYTEEEGVNAKDAAKESFKEPTQEITLEALGDITCLSGYAIQLKDKSTGLTGKYWIIDDKHTFENGVHTMTLTLSFKNLMS